MSPNERPPVDPALFSAVQMVDLDEILGNDTLPVLPFLSKLLISPTFLKRRELLQIIYQTKKMNDVMNLMATRSIDVQDANGAAPISAFESSDGTDKLRIVLAVFVDLLSEVRQQDHSRTKILKSDFFDNVIYEKDISYCLSVLLYKAPVTSVINIIDMCETLLHVKYGPNFICRLVANMPDRCLEVCLSLINFGERQDEEGLINEISEQRSRTIRMICQMNPCIALLTRSEAIRMCKMPSLVFMITLDTCNVAFEKFKKLDQDNSNSTNVDDSDQVKNTKKAYEKLEDCFDSGIAFITGILLGADETTRVWFAQYIKSAQKRIDQGHDTVLAEFRSQIQYFIQQHLIGLFISGECLTNSQLEAGIENELVTMFKDSELAKEANKLIIRATATLRMYCVLRGIGSIKLNETESHNLLRLITVKLPANNTCVNFAITGVCSLLACSALINNQRDERVAAEWLRWTIKNSNYNDSNYASHGKCSISELLLLIAIHFQNNQNNQIAELVCSTLGMKLQIKASVSKCKSLFVQEVFNDQMVAEHASKVPVTKKLNNNVEEFLPVHCIHQLLDSRSFSKHQVPIKEWIFEQICQSIQPLHNILPKLIEAFVNSVIISTSAFGPCGTNQKFSQEEIASVFKVELYSRENSCKQEAKKDVKKKKKVQVAKKTQLEVEKEEPKVACYLTSQVLLLYYLLLYEDVRLSKNLAEKSKVEKFKYSSEFMMDVPIFFILQLVHDNQESFGPILPGLMKLVISQYPQLCLVQHWLTFDNCAPSTYGLDSLLKSKFSNSNIKKTALISSISSVALMSDSRNQRAQIDREQITAGYDSLDDDPLLLTRTLISITTLSQFEIWQYVSPFVSNLAKVLKLTHDENDANCGLLKAIAKLWWKLNQVFPRKLWVLTVNALRSPRGIRSDMDSQPFEYNWNDLVSDPLIILRCDRRVFRSQHLLNINLHMLNAFLSASKRRLYDQIGEQPGSMKDYRSREELYVALIAAQTSAAIQILLESCLPSAKEDEALERKNAKEILSNEESILIDRYEKCVSSICEHLHQVFIADTNLAKLVHFQTYPSQLLSITATKIPSMHICLDFIPELLSQPDLSKQIFVIELTSYLCEKYAITKSLSVAKLCFNASYTLLQVLPSERQAIFFIPVLPALLRICKVFPILTEDAHIILNQIKQITLAHVASTTSRFSLNSTRPFEGLEKTRWSEVRRLMCSFNSQEALYLCIQKCLIDIKKQAKTPHIINHPINYLSISQTTAMDCDEDLRGA